MRSPFGGGAFSSGGIADPEADNGGGSDNDSGGDTGLEGGDARLQTVADRQDDSGGGGGGGGGGSVGPSRQGREDRTAGDAGATITSQPGDDDSGGGGGSVGSVTRDRGGAGAGGGGEPTTGVGADDVADAVTETQAGAPQLDESLSDAASVVGQQAAEFREFQDETTPVRDLGRQTRDFLGLPSEAEVAEATNEAIADVVGLSPRQARLGARSSVLSGVDEAVDTTVDAVPGDGRGLAAGATALALAEPTPFGEAALLGASVAGGLGGSAVTDPEQGEQLVPESPFTQPEIDAPSDPTTERSELDVGDGTEAGEIGLPDDLTTLGGADEIATPEDPAATPSELDVPTGEGRDLSTIRTAQLIGRQEGRERRPGPDGFRRDGDNELQEILSGGGTLGELEESGEPTLEDGGGQFDDVPDDFTSRPTAFEGFQPADTGVEQPTFPEIDPGTGLGIGSSQPPLVPPAVIELPEQGQLTPQTAGLDVFTTPETDIDTDIDFDADVDQPTPTPPEPDFETPTPMTTPTDTSTRFGQADATATPTDTRGGRGPPRTDLPEFDDDEPDEDPMFIGELQGIQAIDARLDPVEFDDV